MEIPQGPLEGPGVPKSTGAGMEVVGGHLPQMQGNQALGTPLQFPEPSNSQGQSVGSDQWMERDLQVALRAQIGSVDAGAKPGDSLISGLAEAARGPEDGPNGIANPDFTGGNRQKRTRQDSGGAGAFTVIPGPIQDYVAGAVAPIEAQLAKNEEVLKAYMSLVQGCITRIDRLERTVRALQPAENP